MSILQRLRDLRQQRALAQSQAWNAEYHANTLGLVLKYFTYLYGSELDTVYAKFYPAFDNMEVILSYSNVRVQLCRERGHIDAFVAPAVTREADIRSGRWFSLYGIIKDITADPVSSRPLPYEGPYASEKQLKEWAELLRLHRDGVERALRDAAV